MTNYFDMKEYFTSKHISISEEPDENGNYSMIFSEDLTSAFKQALLEYAEEQNGFGLLPTTDIHSISPTMFPTSYKYNSFKNLVMEAGCISVSGERSGTSSFNIVRPFSTDNAVSLVLNSGSLVSRVRVRFYDTFSWSEIRFLTYRFETRYVDDSGYVSYKTFSSYEEGEEGLLAPNISTIGWIPGVGSQMDNSYVLYSVDGRKMKVFNSLNALKNYTAGQRSVYFGSGFYEDPGEIKVSFDELEKYLDGKYDSFFDDLKDLIGDKEDSLTEEDLESLVDKILDKMDDIGGGSNPGGNTPGGDDGSDGLLDTLSSYLDSVLAYLDSILASIQDLIFAEQVKPDDEHLDLSDMINDVWKDPQNGSQAVADSLSASFSDIASALTAKFPFCIPHDLYSLFNVFVSTPESRSAVISADTGNIQLYSSAGSVPHFELPLAVESLGIEETIIIDMADFQPLSTVLRVFISLIFAVALMKFTAMVMQLINNAWGGIS